ncbi:unnamed protein product (macronuclear) [Paramecium tetraurelia]|uniref:Transmembrane protein n=1 Tax=Paramecium tetraurelia TaxID=5888 RepID=A0BEE6_PARTE|nr:uncharacterized protein GSPATT00027946001 [Paramecium tetraurelia]CAK56913.1 unnamed protein product [Paramecium tetraurelia]|eukprot:XP_001424311.1 hypothetical protein (macronuclear) [Paramecium tetraurelia strain d4-2]
MFIFYLLAIAKLQRITQPTLTKINEQILHTEYSPNVGQTLLLQYNSYPGVYDMKLNQIIDGQSIEMMPNTTLDPFTLPDCYPYARRLVYQDLFMETFESNSTNAFFTALYIETNQVFATRSDNHLIVMDIDFDGDNIKNFKRVKIIQIPSIKPTSDSHQIVCNTNSCIIFTLQDAFIVNTLTDQFTQLNLNKKQTPQHIHYCEKLQTLYAAYGRDGVDVYLFDNKNNFEYLTSLNLNGNFLEVLTNEESTQLYLLNADVGLLIYEIFSVSQYEDTGIIIYLKNVVSFDFYKKTFILVANTDSGDPYAIEVFLQSNDYYFNRIYSKDMDIFDVYMGEQYAILIGQEIHRVIYHSIYNKHMNKIDVPLYFEDFDLENVEEFRVKTQKLYNQNALDFEPFQKATIYYKQAFMVGISDNDINIFAIKSVFPWLQCRPQSTDVTHYSLTMNSTQCSTKESDNDYSPFSQCVIYHNFTVSGKEILFFEEDENLVIALGSVLGGLIILLLAVLLLCRRILHQKLKNYTIMNEVPVKVEDIPLEPMAGEDALVS